MIGLQGVNFGFTVLQLAYLALRHCCVALPGQDGIRGFLVYCLEGRA